MIFILMLLHNKRNHSNGSLPAKKVYGGGGWWLGVPIFFQINIKHFSYNIVSVEYFIGTEDWLKGRKCKNF